VFENRESYALAHDWLFVQQIREANTLENVVDLGLQQNPHRTDAAVVRCGAPIFFDRVTQAMEIERLQL